jgi:hypothetical protein
MGFNRVDRGCSTMHCCCRVDRGSLAAKLAQPKIERYEGLRAMVILRRIVPQTLAGKSLDKKDADGEASPPTNVHPMSI